MITGKTIALTAAAKSLQSCPTLCDPIDGSPPGSPAPGILQARTLEWVAISFSNVWKWKVKVKSLRHVRLLATPWTTAYQAPPSVGFSRQEHWSGLPLPSPIALTRWTFFGKVMALLFNMLSRFVIAFLPRSERLLISWLQTPSAVILKPRKIKSATVSLPVIFIYLLFPIKCEKFWKRWEYQTTLPASWETCMQVRKQQLELDMEQQTGSK